MKKLPLKIRVLAGISLLLFISSMVVSVIKGSDYNNLFDEYKTLSQQQQNSEKWIHDQNALYYQDILLNGFSNDEIGLKGTIYNAVRHYYRYKIKINGKTININNLSIVDNSYSFSKTECKITIEESFLSHATNYFPKGVLDYFRFLKNEGNGGEDLSPEQIISGKLNIDLQTVAADSVTRRDDGNKTILDVNIPVFNAGQTIIITFHKDIFELFGISRIDGKKLNEVIKEQGMLPESLSIQIWTVV